MESAQQAIVRIFAEINEVARNPKIERLTEQAEVLCLAVTCPTVDERWEKLGLTRYQIRMMDLLASGRGRAVSKSALYDSMYFDDGDARDIKIVDVQICKMRAKLRGSPYEIETIWGQGYRLKEIAA